MEVLLYTERNMEIIKVTSRDMIEWREDLLERFKKYYGEVSDIITPEDLFAHVVNGILEDKCLLLIWGENNFVVAFEVDNKMKDRKEVVIQTLYNKDRGVQDLVISVIEEWAISKGIGIVCYLSVNPLAFQKLYGSKGFEMVLGFFEKNLIKESEG